MKASAIACALLVAVTTAAGVALAAFKGKNGRLAYQAQVGKHVQLFTVRPDGSGVRQMTSFTDSDATSAVWSPNANTIAFTRQWGPNKAQVYTMNADGTGVHPFDRTLRGLVGWLPDGKHVLVLKGLHWTIVTASGTTPQDARIPGSGDSPCILPDGKRVVMLATLGRMDGKAAIFVARIGGGHGTLKRISPWQSMSQKIDCSPDGSAVVFSTPDPDDSSRSSNVYTVRVDGTGLRQLTHTKGGTVNNLADAWSPDGTKIAFASNRSSTYEIYTMNADGTGVRQLTRGAEAHLASWGSHP
jgi:TolB protein